MAKFRILIFTKPPLPGNVKIRLIPALGTEGAATIHREMAEYTFRWAHSLERSKLCSVEVWFKEGRPAMEKWLEFDWPLREQRGVDFGARMFNAFFDVFRDGCRRAVVVGTDCPELTGAHLRRVFKALDDYDVVLVPTKDGGYSLIGLKNPEPELFFRIPWGSNRVLEMTMERARSEGLTVKQMGEVRDVDYPQDLAVWTKVKQGRLSIILPTLNDEKSLPVDLERIEKDGQTEVIVADGGSTDRTAEIAKSLGARVIVSRTGRAGRLNAAAETAGGSILLFLRPGIQLPPGYASLAREVMQNPYVAVGAFPIRIDPGPVSPGQKEVEALSFDRLRIPFDRRLLFMRASLFRELGGCRELPLFEEKELFKRARRWGEAALASEPAVYSARRFSRPGVLRAKIINRMIHAGWTLGVSPKRLAELYSGRSEKNQD